VGFISFPALEVEATFLRHVQAGGAQVKTIAGSWDVSLTHVGFALNLFKADRLHLFRGLEVSSIGVNMGAGLKLRERSITVPVGLGSIRIGCILGFSNGGLNVKVDFRKYPALKYLCPNPEVIET
jgi:hypothetical protein